MCSIPYPVLLIFYQIQNSQNYIAHVAHNFNFICSVVTGYNRNYTYIHALNVEEWRRCLVCHPDQEFYVYIMNGISEGFQIGFDHQYLCREATANMLSAQQNPKVMEEYLTVGQQGKIIRLVHGCSDRLETPNQLVWCYLKKPWPGNEG